MNKIPIGISSCLLGQEVRYDGGHKHNDYLVSTLGEYFDYRPFCPEMSIGLGVPREPVHLVQNNGRLRAVEIKNPALDITDRLTACADQQRPWLEHICGYILKKDSPSCGMERVKVYPAGAPAGEQPRRNGSGIYARRLMEDFPHLPLEEEGRLCDPVLRENFEQRVFVYQRWQELLAGGLSAAALTAFHARHKLILMSHDQNLARDLGRKLSALTGADLRQFAQQYLADLMALLKIPATRGNHVNVLQHIQGYLKRELDQDDKQELAETIEHYRQGYVPLIVPLTLLRHHFRRSPDAYIEQSYYMRPHPAELMLLNEI